LKSFLKNLVTSGPNSEIGGDLNVRSNSFEDKGRMWKNIEELIIISAPDLYISA